MMQTTEKQDLLRKVADLSTFATLGTLGTTQNLARAILGSIEGAEHELVAEETLCLVATVTARAASVGLKENADMAEALLPALMEIPFTYRDYLIGGMMLSQNDPSLAETSEEIYERLNRKQEFYKAHFPAGQFPGKHALGDKMDLWMGRVSPPKLTETPQERMKKLGLVDPLLTHLKLIIASARRHAGG